MVNKHSRTIQYLNHHILQTTIPIIGVICFGIIFGEYVNEINNKILNLNVEFVNEKTNENVNCEFDFKKHFGGSLCLTPAPRPATRLDFNDISTLLCENYILEDVFGVANDIVCNMICNENFYDNINGYFQLLYPTPISIPTPKPTIGFNDLDTGMLGINILKYEFGTGLGKNVFDNEICNGMIDFYLFFEKLFFIVLFEFVHFDHVNLF